MLPFLLAAALPQLPAPVAYEAVFKPLAKDERRYAALGPVGPYYPRAAINDRQVTIGEAVLDCRSRPDGRLDRCRIVSSVPLAQFGLAARIMAERGRIGLENGPGDGGTVRIHVPFDPRTPPQIEP